jgi:hypothetical protein
VASDPKSPHSKGEFPGLLMHTIAITSAGTLAAASAGVMSAPTVRWVSLPSFQLPDAY